MAPASVQVVCMEPVVFLRGQSAVGEDARGRRRQIDFDAPPSQLRGLVTLTLPRASRVREITVTLQGKARTDWPEGIGPNRLDTVDESVIFRQKVTLYSARESAPARRPRASSIGPGINWANDDLAWPSPGATSGSRGGGGHTSNGERNSPSNLTSEARRGGGGGGGGGEASKSPKITRSITKTAAKAGAAILPPTLMRDLQGGGGSSSSSSSSGGQNGVAKHAAQTSPTLHRPSSGGTQSAPRSPLSMLVTPSSSSLPDPSQESYFDPPPNYGGNGSASSSEQLSSPLQHSLSNSASASAHHPQSISAAGPGQRSILHVTSTSQRQASEQRARLNTNDSPNSGSTLNTAGHGVRFDPQAVNNAFEREGVSPSSSSMTNATSTATATTANRLSLQLPGQAAPTNNVGNGNSSDGNAATAPVRSEPNSRRVSVDQAAAKLKGKVTSASHSPTSTPSVPTTEKGATRRGIKNLLGGARRKDEDSERKASRSSTAGDYGHHVEMTTTTSLQSPSSQSGIGGGEEEWREFPKGTHSYPFSIPLPSNLPPTLHADFGSNAYTLRAHVHRAGPLTANLTSETEVTLVHAPNEDGQDDIETIVVERNWEDALRYMIVVMGKSFPVGGKIPIWAKFVPMEKVRIHRILATLEERTTYYAKGRKVARHEVPRRWTLLKVQPPATATITAAGVSNKKAAAAAAAVHGGILPILSDAPDAILQSPLAPMTRSAALSYSADASQDREEIEAAALASLGDPTGPWELAMDLEVPKTSSTRINISSNHNKSNIAVVHVVKVAIRVERLDSYKGVDPSAMADGDRQLFDILIEAPVAINHSHTANAWLTLPDYWSVPSLDHPETGDGGSSRQDGRSNVTASTSSNGGIRIGNKFIAQSPSTTIAKGKSNASSSTSGSDAAARSAARLAQLGRQWLSLTGASSATSNGVQRTQQGSRTDATFTPQSAGQAMVTYAGNYGEQDFNDDHGLPTYAMIDNARGSVDPPPGEAARRTAMTAAKRR